MSTDGATPTVPLNDRIEGIYTLLQGLAGGQEAILDHLRLLTETTGSATARPSSPIPEVFSKMSTTKASRFPLLPETSSRICASPKSTARRGSGASRPSGFRLSSQSGVLDQPAPAILTTAPSNNSTEQPPNGLPKLQRTRGPTFIEIPSFPLATGAGTGGLTVPGQTQFREASVMERKHLVVPELASLSACPRMSSEHLTAPVQLATTPAAPDPTTQIPKKSRYSQTSLAVSETQGLVLYTDIWWRQIIHTALVILSCLEFIIITSSFVACSSISQAAIPVFVLTTLLLLIEIGLNLISSQPFRGWETIDAVHECRKLYLKGWFGWDVVVAIPLDLFAAPLATHGLCVRYGASAFSILALVRILHIVRIPTYFRRRNRLMDMPRWVAAILFLAISTLLLHTFAVIWMLWATEDEQGIHGIEDHIDFANQYVSAFNWAFQSFVHGKSDVHGYHTGVQIFSLFVKILGFLVVSTMEAKLAEFFVNHDPFHVWARQRRQQLASLISVNNVSWDIQKSMMIIYPTLVQAKKRQFYNVLEDLPPFLSNKINDCLRLQWIHRIPMFSSLEEKCQVALANALTEETFAAETDIIRRGDVATSMYFLVHGIADVIVPGSDGCEVLLSALKEGSWFGEVALLYDTTRSATIRAATEVYLYRLEKQDFDVITEEFPNLRDRLIEATSHMKPASSTGAKSDEESPPPQSPVETSSLATPRRFRLPRALSRTLMKATNGANPLCPPTMGNNNSNVMERLCIVTTSPTLATAERHSSIEARFYSPCENDPPESPQHPDNPDSAQNFQQGS